MTQMTRAWASPPGCHSPRTVCHDRMQLRCLWLCAIKVQFCNRCCSGRSQYFLRWREPWHVALGLGREQRWNRSRLRRVSHAVRPVSKCNEGAAEVDPEKPLTTQTPWRMVQSAANQSLGGRPGSLAMFPTSTTVAVRRSWRAAAGFPLPALRRTGRCAG